MDPFTLMEAFDDAYQNDDVGFEEKGERLISLYQDADEQARHVIDDILINLCGYGFQSLVDKSR